MTLESLITPRNSEADAENSISKPQIWQGCPASGRPTDTHRKVFQQ
jgi:hypothetical protein